MKRRAFLTTIGAGSIGTGALVGTGGFSRVESQRRVKIEVDDRELFDASTISFIAFCATETPPELSRVEAIEWEDDNGERGDPVTVEWESVNTVEEIVLWTGQQTGFYLFLDVNATEGIVTTRDDDTIPDNYLLPDERGVSIEDTDRSQPDPCPDKEDTKYEWDDEEDEFFPE